MNRRIAAQRVDLGDQRIRIDVGRQFLLERLDADLGAGAHLVGDINRRRRVVADQDDREARA